MNDTAKKIVTILLVIFALSVALTVIGQRQIGVAGLSKQLLGVAGLVFLLWNYNRRYK